MQDEPSLLRLVPVTHAFVPSGEAYEKLVDARPALGIGNSYLEFNETIESWPPEETPFQCPNCGIAGTLRDLLGTVALREQLGPGPHGRFVRLECCGTALYSTEFRSRLPGVVVTFALAIPRERSEGPLSPRIVQAVERILECDLRQEWGTLREP